MLLVFPSHLMPLCIKCGYKSGILLLVALTIVIVKLLQIYIALLGNQSSKAIHREKEIKDSFYANDGQWYNFSTRNFRLFVYSAFYDDRPSLLSDPVIRIIGISDTIEKLNAYNITQLYCILHHEAKDIVVFMDESPKAIGFGWALNKIYAKEYMYTCPTLTGMIPNSVSIVTSQRDHYPSGVPVALPNKADKQKDFCICMHAAYGSLDPYRIIEWMELQKILGISLVGISVFASSNETLKVLKHYADEGFVDLRKTNHIYANDETEKHYKLQQSPTINDCMYRHMFECRRMVIIDFDEFIIPRIHRNISELVTYLDQKNTKKKTLKLHFAFRNNYFFMDLPPDDKISPYLKVLQFRKKVQVSPIGYSVKSIINPQACTHGHNHYCWGVTANYSRRYVHYDFTETVNPKLGVNQHYKMCHFSDDECRAMMQNVTRDDIMMQFKDLLTERVSKKVKTIMGHDI